MFGILIVYRALPFLLLVLPLGWQTYPGVYAQNGVYIRDTPSSDECLQYCARLPMCGAIDFDVQTASCYVHNMTLACSTLNPSPDMYHAKRAPGCGENIITVLGKVLRNTVAFAFH